MAGLELKGKDESCDDALTLSQHESLDCASALSQERSGSSTLLRLSVISGHLVELRRAGLKGTSLLQRNAVRAHTLTLQSPSPSPQGDSRLIFSRPQNPINQQPYPLQLADSFNQQYPPTNGSVATSCLPSSEISPRADGRTLFSCSSVERFHSTDTKASYMSTCSVTSVCSLTPTTHAAHQTLQPKGQPVPQTHTPHPRGDGRTLFSRCSDETQSSSEFKSTQSTTTVYPNLDGSAPRRDGRVLFGRCATEPPTAYNATLLCNGKLLYDPSTNDSAASTKGGAGACPPVCHGASPKCGMCPTCTPPPPASPSTVPADTKPLFACPSAKEVTKMPTMCISTMPPGAPGADSSPLFANPSRTELRTCSSAASCVPCTPLPPGTCPTVACGITTTPLPSSTCSVAAFGIPSAPPLRPALPVPGVPCGNPHSLPSNSSISMPAAARALSGELRFSNAPLELKPAVYESKDCFHLAVLLPPHLSPGDLHLEISKGRVLKVLTCNAPGEFKSQILEWLLPLNCNATGRTTAELRGSVLLVTIQKA